MKLLHWATTLVTTLLVTTTAHAGSLTADDYAEDAAPLVGDYQAGKVYFGAAMGYISSSDRGRGFMCGDATCTDTSWKAYAGYQATEKIAAELSYHNFGHYEFWGGTGTSKALWDSDPTGLSASAKVSTGLFDKVDVFGRVGFLAWNAPTEITPQYSGSSSSSSSEPMDNSGTDLILGVGADYKLGDNLTVRGEYEKVGGDMNAHTFSVGANYKTF
ncbi:MAG: outer membrane beta-barrel protein [Thiofilum sp.]|uniref:outer membrane beta-barrel protein n=1 Tax=Thiofilum sp. TaxID=2212733 RepID=UPI0025E7631D|nr:outer membrane beta-barrel protein [Thiofilum sp.]MBK8453894.1 outer membrane beta-barrel protein [Thiofilum sp.]